MRVDAERALIRPPAKGKDDWPRASASEKRGRSEESRAVHAIAVRRAHCRAPSVRSHEKGVRHTVRKRGGSVVSWEEQGVSALVGGDRKASSKSASQRAALNGPCSSKGNQIGWFPKNSANGSFLQGTGVMIAQSPARRLLSSSGVRLHHS